MTQNVWGMQPAEHELLSGLLNQLVLTLQHPTGPKPTNAPQMLAVALRAQTWLRRHPATPLLAPRVCRDPRCAQVFQPINPRALYHTDSCRFRHNKARRKVKLNTETRRRAS